MDWLFANAFEYRDHRYYFCDGEGEAYPLGPGEAGRIRVRLGAVLALSVLGFVGWGAHALYAGAQQLSGSGAVGASWLLDSSVMYPAAIAYWTATWLLSCATWLGLSWRFAGREPEPGISAGRASGSLKSTKPLPTLALGVIMFAFVAQGFGDVCFLFRGTGHCEIVTITRS